MNPCLEFFTRLEEEGAQSGRSRFERLVSEGSPVGWVKNSLSASKFSPGVVADEEALFRSLKAIFVDDLSSEVKVGALQDFMKGGFSVDRLSVCTLQEALQRAQERNRQQAGDKPEIPLAGFLQFQSGQLCSIEHNGQRAIAFFDTSLPQNPAHAEGFVVLQLSKSEWKDIRSQLLDRLKGSFKPTSLADASGAERPGSEPADIEPPTG